MNSNGFNLTSGQEPWSDSPEAFFESLHQWLTFDAAVIGIFHAKKPRPDELLASEGFSGQAIARWCAEGWDNEFYRSAKRKGVSLMAGSKTGDPELGRFEQVMALALSESVIDEPRSWWLILGRRGQEFSSIEQQEAGLLLKQWQVAFDQSREPAAGRVLLGHDNRLIQADPWTRAKFLHHPQMLEDLQKTLHPVVQQRYPELKDMETRDVAVELAGKSYWICFHRHALAGVPESQHWYLELHPLEQGELPTVGEVLDERISRSLAFIHENFVQSPSLAETAEAAHVSPFHFHRLFTQSVGISPKQYVQKKQLQVARFLLRATRAPVGDIAIKAGFSSHGHFTSTFHRMVGRSPRDYRESH